MFMATICKVLGIDYTKQNVNLPYQPDVPAKGLRWCVRLVREDRARSGRLALQEEISSRDVYNELAPYTRFVEERFAQPRPSSNRRSTDSMNRIVY